MHPMLKTLPLAALLLAAPPLARACDTTAIFLGFARSATGTMTDRTPCS